MWICVFNETDTRFCLCQDTGAMNRPLRLTECFVGVFGMFATHFVGVCGYFTDSLLAFCGMFATHWQSLRDTFTECSQRVSYLCVTYSPYKSMVFALQKYGFWRAKTPFLHCKNPLFEMQYTKQRTRNNEVWYYI